MKKIILGYTFISYLISLVLSFIALFTLDINIKSVFVFILSAITVCSVYLVFKEIRVKESLFYLTFLNLVQSFTFLVLGISYKFLLGSNFYVYYFVKDNETFLRTSFRILETNLYLDNSNSNDFLIGINVIHFILFLYFNSYLRKVK